MSTPSISTLPAVGIVEARQQRYQRRLAAAGAADDRHRRAGGHVQVISCSTVPLSDVVGEIRRRGIPPRRARAPSVRVPPCGSIGASSTSNTLAPAAMLCCSGPLTFTSAAAARSPAAARSESGRTRRPASCRWHLAVGHVQHARQADGGDHLHDRIAGGARGTRRMLVWRLSSLATSNRPLQVLLGVEHLDHAVRIDRLLGDARDIAHRILDARAVAAEAPVDAAHQPGDRRRHEQREQRQPPVQPEQRSRR